MSDFFENYKKNRRKLDMDDYLNSEEGLHCPHCGEFHIADDLPACDYPEVWIETDTVRPSVKFECHECEREFLFRTIVTHSWDIQHPNTLMEDQSDE